MKSFQPSILIKRTLFPTTKVEVNKPDLRRMFLHMVPDQRNTKASLVTEDVIIGLSLVFRRLKEKSHTQNVFDGQFSTVIKRFVLNIIILKNDL